MGTNSRIKFIAIKTNIWGSHISTGLHPYFSAVDGIYLIKPLKKKILKEKDLKEPKIAANQQDNFHEREFKIIIWHSNQSNFIQKNKKNSSCLLILKNNRKKILLESFYLLVNI